MAMASKSLTKEVAYWSIISFSSSGANAPHARKRLNY
jgi:hypothetical protein